MTETQSQGEFRHDLNELYQLADAIYALLDEQRARDD